VRRIYVDLDDVLCETARAFLEVLERDFGKVVRFEDIHSFDLGRSFGLAPDELTRFMKSVHAPQVLAAMEPVEGAVKVLAGWVEAGYEVAVVTGRPTSTQAASAEWLVATAVPHHSLTFVDKYARPEWSGDGPTALTLEELSRTEFCLAVEDSLRVARHLARELGLQVLLLDRPWNRGEPGLEESARGQILRCRDWGEIAQRSPIS
jgi:uncharacterized HAD superfamily protein